MFVIKSVCSLYNVSQTKQTLDFFILTHVILTDFHNFFDIIFLTKSCMYPLLTFPPQHKRIASLLYES